MSHFNRYMYNMKIIKDITAMIFKYPDLRFFQLLVKLKIVEYDPKDNTILDKFYEDSVETYNRLQKNL